MHGPHCNQKMRLFVFFGIWKFVFYCGSRLGRTGFKGELDSQQISQQHSSNCALKLVES